ncbi:hypothetical protein [Terasakiella pusilla]|uniref:hypothetical protein n=1 Tax=Terasakiella pusilla TaxID=64973 RepID=UPI003AA7E90D
MPSPLFLPLKSEFFYDFQSGKKTHEYRRHKGQFNARTWAVGRRVNLRRGYSTTDNLYGVVISFTVFRKSEIIGPLAKTITNLYGPDDEEICEIGIQVDGV